jgi:hypothetical protein
MQYGGNGAAKQLFSVTVFCRWLLWLVIEPEESNTVVGA